MVMVAFSWQCSIRILEFMDEKPISQDKEPSARSELAVIQPFWPSVDLPNIVEVSLDQSSRISKILNRYIC